MVSLLNPKKKKKKQNKTKNKNKAIVMWSNNRNTYRFSFYYIYIFDGARNILINLQRTVEMNDNVDAPYELRR